MVLIPNWKNRAQWDVTAENRLKPNLPSLNALTSIVPNFSVHLPKSLEKNALTNMKRVAVA